MKTRVTELLGIKHPIVQSGMALVASPELVVATCNGGGLGILASMLVSPEKLRDQIRWIREQVGNKPFAVNIVPMRPRYESYIKVILEEKVQVWSSGLRDPFGLVNMKKPETVKYLPTVGAVRQAIKVEKEGADAVIVQGLEAGGHASLIATTVLIPEVVEAVKIPVIAAGGFCDGKGLAAALALGAEGIAMGTRFATAQESPLPLKLKEEYLKAQDRDATLSAVWDGMPERVLRGKKMEHYRGWWTHPWEMVPNFIDAKTKYNATIGDLWKTAGYIRAMGGSIPQYLAGMEKARRTMETGDIVNGYTPSGQVVGRIKDIATCKEIIERTVREAEQIIKSLPGKLSLQ